MWETNKDEDGGARIRRFGAVFEHVKRGIEEKAVEMKGRRLEDAIERLSKEAWEIVKMREKKNDDRIKEEEAKPRSEALRPGRPKALGPRGGMSQSY